MQGQHPYPWRDAIRVLSLRSFSTMPASASNRAGAACLPLLDSDGIAAATVAADSACIGDGESTLTQGIISAVNETAYRLGARVGETALDAARTVTDKT
jgi:hypothetical protein